MLHLATTPILSTSVQDNLSPTVNKSQPVPATAFPWEISPRPAI